MLTTFHIGFIPFSPMINGAEKFGYPKSRTRPTEDAAEQKAWDDFYASVSAEIQIILNTCARKFLFS